MARPSYRQDNEHFKFTNVNPKNLLSSADCVVRAISIATKKPWDKVYIGLCNIGLEMNDMPNADKVYERYLEDNGWKMLKQPRKSDNTKYRAYEIAEMSRGSGVVVIIRVANHISVIYNGYIRDTWDCGDKTIGNFWIHKSQL